jgi:hypothetical protein
MPFEELPEGQTNFDPKAESEARKNLTTEEISKEEKDIEQKLNKLGFIVSFSKNDFLISQLRKSGGSS